MSLVLSPCPRCWGETWGVEHTREDCDQQVVENRRAGEQARRSNEAWRAKLAKLRAEGKEPPRIELPPARLVTPSERRIRDEE